MVLTGKVIGVHSAPRSGSSWLGQIFNSSPQVAFRYQPLFSYSLKSALSDKSSIREITMVYDKMLATQDSFILQNDPNYHHNYPYFAKSDTPSFLVFKHVRYHHILDNLLKNSNLKLVMLIRHPCAVINSWIHSPKEFNPEWDVFEEWYCAPSKNQGKIEEYYGFEKWVELTSLFLMLRNKYPNTTYLLKYQDLIRNTEKEVKDLFYFCGIPWQEQTAQFIAESTSLHTDHPYGVHKVRTSDDTWKETLDGEIQSRILKELGTSSIARLF